MTAPALNHQQAVADGMRLPMTVAEYFAGIGLFRMGLAVAGWRVIYSNDWNPEREQMYRGFFNEKYCVEDVFSVDADKIPTTTLATCSFPCVDLSLAGKREGINGKHSGAFWGFHEILKQQGASSPPLVLLENVTGWLSSNGGKDFYLAVESMNNIGYACDVFMLNARSFVPQSRPRLFLIGIKDSFLPIDSMRNVKRSKQLMPPALEHLMLEKRGLHWAHLDIPEPPPYKTRGLTADIVEHLPANDSRWWPEEKVAKHIDMMNPAHLAMVEKMANDDKENFRTFFRRRRADGQKAEVRSDDIAGCLRTATGGSGKQFLVAMCGGKIRMRTVTARECARLQGVPDEFAIRAKTERQSLNAFGDAVCVPVVSWIATEILSPLVDNR